MELEARKDLCMDFSQRWDSNSMLKGLLDVQMQKKETWTSYLIKDKLK
jgi:hypothetical protein